MSLLTGSVLLAGCTAPYTEKPIATNFKATEQNKLQSAAHWQVIAEDTAAQLIQSLPGKQALYVVQNEQQSPFQQSFNQQLISTLITNGFPVMKQPHGVGTLTVEVNATPVRFRDRAVRDPIMGEFTTLAGGLWVLRNIGKNTSPGAAMMGAAVSADVYFAANSKYAKGLRPKTELVVTVSASDSTRYYANTTNVYYTTENDFHNYNPGLPVTKFQVKGD